MDIYNYRLRQEFWDGQIDVIYTERTKMMADDLTKALTDNAFKSIVEQMNLRNIMPS